MTLILDGKQAAARVLEGVRKRAEALGKKGVVPGLATVLVGEETPLEAFLDRRRPHEDPFIRVTAHAEPPPPRWASTGAASWPESWR